MSKPVKVANELYLQLQSEAQERGITIQQAMESRLESARSEIDRVAHLCEKGTDELRVREKELKAARSAGQASSSRVVTLRTEITSLRDSLAGLNEERRQLAEWREHGESLSRERSREKNAWEELEASYRGWIFVLGVAVLAVGTFLAVRYMRNSNEHTSEETQEARARSALFAWDR